MKKNNFKTNCEECNKAVKRFRDLKKIGGKYICKECVRKRRKKHREFLRRDIIKIRKRRSPEEIKEEQKKLNKIYKSIIPKIESPKAKRQKINKLGLYLSKNERLVLYKQLLRNGSNSKQANERIDNLNNEMSNHLKKLRYEVKSDRELNIRFKEKFAELMEEG